MSADLRMRSLVVAGSGLVGWSAAAMLQRRLPGVRVILTGDAPGPDAVAERIASSLPSIGGFHGDIGLDEGQVVQGIGASFRLGTLFDGWAGDRPAYVHAYGEVGRSLGPTSFHMLWTRAALEGRAAPFESHSLAAALARAGRFVHPADDAESPLAGFEYGLSLDPRRYRELMRAYALHLGVAEQRGAVADVRLAGETGFVEALVLADGREVAGDLFVDCTGPAALVRARLDDRFEEWGHWLPCDRLLFGEAPGSPDPTPLDTVAAHAAGWRWRTQSRALTQHGLAYASAHLSDSRAERVFRAGAATEPSEAPVAIRAGQRRDPWLRNCVAVGDAAVMLEPLEWTNLHLAHSALDRIASKLPDRDCSRVELWDYNRETMAEAARARDFAVLHYAISDRPRDAMWRDAAAAPSPDTLAHSLALFRERGRLPYYEEETFTRHSWTTVLFGQGVMPRRADPLIDTVSDEVADRAMAQIRERIAATVPGLPGQGEYLRHLAAQGAGR
ncbi:tryptophan halogenase family protein [Sphingomonas sp.]|uniref:tryptophan halogenase family protein n=1 Tax=Sphingomonas sp. TaxID=28214 RepID=UPI0025E51022|nr:tryptophan halogenase family protein [Sphingomonas sp.]